MPRKTTKPDTATDASADAPDGVLSETDGAIATEANTAATDGAIAKETSQPVPPTTTEPPGEDVAIATSAPDVTQSETSAPPEIEMVTVEPLKGKTIDGKSGRQRLPKGRAEFLSSKGMCQIVEPAGE